MIILVILLKFRYYNIDTLKIQEQSKIFETLKCKFSKLGENEIFLIYYYYYFSNSHMMIGFKYFLKSKRTGYNE